MIGSAKSAKCGTSVKPCTESGINGEREVCGRGTGVGRSLTHGHIVVHTYILQANIEIVQLEHLPNYETNDALPLLKRYYS